MSIWIKSSFLCNYETRGGHLSMTPIRDWLCLGEPLSLVDEPNRDSSSIEDLISSDYKCLSWSRVLEQSKSVKWDIFCCLQVASEEKVYDDPPPSYESAVAAPRYSSLFGEDMEVLNPATPCAKVVKSSQPSTDSPVWEAITHRESRRDPLRLKGVTSVQQHNNDLHLVVVIINSAQWKHSSTSSPDRFA